MAYEMILDSLFKWNKDELLFKDYYHTVLEKETLDLFLDRHKEESEKDALEIALHPETIEYDKTEDEFISSGRNVSLVKHPRYLPLFYHQHAFFEIIYVLSGKCVQLFQDKKIYLSAGDFCLIAPSVIHGIEVFNDDTIVLNILIRRSTFLDIFINTVRDKTQISLFFMDNLYAKKKIRYLLFHTEEDTVIRNYVLDMFIEQQNPDEFSDRIICSQLTIFFNQLTRRHKKTMEIPDAHQGKSNYENTMVNYILTNYATVTLEELADEFHFSVPYCSKLFKTITGYTFSDFLTNVRLQQGENLLLLTQLNVADISDRIGYKNPETFIRIFKRFYNSTPSQYRKLNNI